MYFLRLSGGWIPVRSRRVHRRGLLLLPATQLKAGSGEETGETYRAHGERAIGQEEGNTTNEEQDTYAWV